MTVIADELVLLIINKNEKIALDGRFGIDSTFEIVYSHSDVGISFVISSFYFNISHSTLEQKQEHYLLTNNFGSRFVSNISGNFYSVCGFSTAGRAFV